MKVHQTSSCYPAFMRNLTSFVTRHSRRKPETCTSVELLNTVFRTSLSNPWSCNPPCLGNIFFPAIADIAFAPGRRIGFGVSRGPIQRRSRNFAAIWDYGNPIKPLPSKLRGRAPTLGTCVPHFLSPTWLARFPSRTRLSHIPAPTITTDKIPGGTQRSELKPRAYKAASARYTR